MDDNLCLFLRSTYEKNEYLDIFLTFFKIGLFTFGGGYAMIGVHAQGYR